MPRRRNRARSSLTTQVRLAYRQKELARACTLPEAGFGRAYGMNTTYVDQPRSRWQRASDPAEDYYHFKDNGARVLAVAHLDTVVEAKHRVPRFVMTREGPLVTCGALDDRLGAYVILHLLPRLKVNCDVLLTVGEESGASTAAFFEPGKDYDHVIEFDRMGTDVVLYQYEDAASRAAVQASGAVVGTGSFSDISVLDMLRIKAFNWGVGYRGNYHSPKGYAWLNDTFAMVAKYLRFHAQNANVTMPHEPYWLRGKENYLEQCVICQAPAAVDLETDACTACGGCQGCFMDLRSCLCYTSHALSGKPLGLPAGDDAAELHHAIREALQKIGREELKALTPGSSDDGSGPFALEDEEAEELRELEELEEEELEEEEALGEQDALSEH
jgi:hypothetical protein